MESVRTAVVAVDECGSTRPASPVPFSEVEAVASGWILDYACRCLCRHFCEGNHQDFQRSRDLALAVIKGLHRIETHQMKTVLLCQLLTYVAAGKSLESHLWDDQRISPLEKALSVWISLQKLENKQDQLHECIKRLIQIQAVAVHMEKGYFKEAAEVLERLFPESLSNEPLRMKLAAVTRKKDPYHQLLEHFSFHLMTEKIKSYIYTFWKEESSSFLIKEATKEAEMKRSGQRVDVQRDCIIGTDKENNFENTHRSQKWSSSLDSCAFCDSGPVQTSQRTLKKKNILQSKKNLQNIESNEQDGEPPPTGQKRQQWSFEEDRKLKQGVQRFGVGHWTQILQHYDFADRTNVMLKDRWRTMVRLGMV